MHYGVVGGGVLGLTLSLRLAQRGHDVTLLERSAVPGGLASSFELEPGVWLERFYHHIFASDRAAIRLLEELGMGDALEWYRPVSTVTVDGRPVELDSPGSLLRFRALSIADRLRLAVVLALLRARPSPGLVEDQTADAWMRRACGEPAHSLIWQPLLRSKFGDAFDRITMAWLWARLHDRTSRLGYVRPGFHAFYATLEQAARAAGTTVHYGAVVQAMAVSAGSPSIRWTDRHGDLLEARFDRVVSTLPPHVTCALLGDKPRPIPTLPSRAAQCVVLSLDRPLTGIYWIGVTEADAPFLAVVEHTAMVDPSVYGGRHLVYLGAYRDPDDPRLALPSSDLIDLAVPQLRSLNAAFDPSWITASWVFTAFDAQPIVDVGYRTRIPPFRLGKPGMWGASMFHVYPHDRGQTYAIELAERVLSELESTPP